MALFVTLPLSKLPVPRTWLANRAVWGVSVGVVRDVEAYLELVLIELLEALSGWTEYGAPKSFLPASLGLFISP